jgi:hypothetical protein
MARKKSNIGKYLLYGILAIAFILIILYFSGTLQTMTGGATVLSIDNVQLIRSSELGNEEAYLITAVLNRGGESIVGEIKPEDIAKFGVQAPAGKFKIYFDVKNISCNYRIIDDNFVIYKIFQATAASCSLSDAIPWNNVDLNTVKLQCKGQRTGIPPGTETPAPGAPIATGVWACDYLEDIQTTPIRPDLGAQASEWAYVSPPTTNSGCGSSNHWRVTHIAGLPWYRGYAIDTIAVPDYVIEVKIEGENGTNYSAILTPQQSTAMLGDVARIKFTGSMVAQQFCPIPSVEKRVVKLLGNASNYTNITQSQFKLVKYDDYRIYKDNFIELINYDNNYFSYQRKDPGVGADYLWGKMSTLNAMHRYMFGYNDTSNCKILENTLILSCAPEKDIIYPQIQLLVKASWIGLSIPQKAKPQILNVAVNKTYYEGDVNLIQIDLKNIGEEGDSFDVNLICNSTLSLANTRTVLDVGETKKVNLYFIGPEGNYSCQVNAYSVNAPNNRDSKNITIEIIKKPMPEFQCKKVPKQPCAEAEWQGYPICEWDTSKCVEKFESRIKLLYITIGALVGAIVIGIITYALIKRKRGKRRK